MEASQCRERSHRQEKNRGAQLPESPLTISFLASVTRTCRSEQVGLRAKPTTHHTHPSPLQPSLWPHPWAKFTASRKAWVSLLTRRPQPSFPHGAPHLASRVADWCGTRSRAEPLQQLADGEQAAAGHHRLPPSASSRASHLLPARPPGLPRPPHTGEPAPKPPRREHSLGAASASICCSLRSLWNADSFSTEKRQSRDCPKSKQIPGVSCLLSTAALGPGPGGPLGPVGPAAPSRKHWKEKNFPPVFLFAFLWWQAGGGGGLLA